MRRLLLVFICTATVATAHTGVKNAAVLARMDGMKSISGSVETLVKMSTGALAFDAAQAAAAKEALRADATQIAALFDAQESDPKSDALPVIWDNWTAYSAQADKLIAATEALDTASPDTLKAGIPAIAVTCRDCHGEYRVKSN